MATWQVMMRSSCDFWFASLLPINPSFDPSLLTLNLVCPIHHCPAMTTMQLRCVHLKNCQCGLWFVFALTRTKWLTTGITLTAWLSWTWTSSTIRWERPERYTGWFERRFERSVSTSCIHCLTFVYTSSIAKWFHLWRDILTESTAGWRTVSHCTVWGSSASPSRKWMSLTRHHWVWSRWGWCAPACKLSLRSRARYVSWYYFSMHSSVHIFSWGIVNLTADDYSLHFRLPVLAWTCQFESFRNPLLTGKLLSAVSLH